MSDTKTLAVWENLSMDLRPKIRYWLPAAAVDAADLRAEIAQLHARGFGGVEAISLIISIAVPFLGEIARSEDGWGGKRWNDMIGIINHEAKRLGMTFDVTNGPGWPISSPMIVSADDPAILCELTYGKVTVASGARYADTLPKGRSAQEEGEAELLHVSAYVEDGNETLRLDSYMDLTPFTSGGNVLNYVFPECEGAWRVFAFYQQPSIQKTNVGQNYVIDHLSETGVKACEKYWDGVFAEHSFEAMESLFCDSLEYRVALDWTPGFLVEFERRRGYCLRPYLPFVGIENTFPRSDIAGYATDDSAISRMVNNDYLETLTELHCENHLAGLTRMAQKHGKTLRYQVAYNKPFEVERCGLYVPIPENEALGRPSLDYQKAMAAAVHLGRKTRYSFECAAEFGNSYGQDIEDLLWWVKRSYMAGMNAQVLHGGSYSGGYRGRLSEDGNVPGSKWPGYEGFMKTVSNNWNRTLSVSDMRGCLDAITRMNAIFRKQARVDCAVLRNQYGSDGEGSEFCLYDDGGALLNTGYSYEFVSERLLHLDVCTVQDHMLDRDGVGYKCLIVPETKEMDTTMLERIAELASAGLPIVWAGKKPTGVWHYSQWNTPEKRDAWHAALERAWCAATHVECLVHVAGALDAMGIQADVSLAGSMDIATATRWGDDVRYYALYAYNRIILSKDDPNPDELSCSAMYRKGTTKGSYARPGDVSRRRIAVRLRGYGAVHACDPWSGKTRVLDFLQDGDYMAGYVDIQEDEMIILAVLPRMERDARVERLATAHPVRFETLELASFEPDAESEVSFLRSHFAEEGIAMQLQELRPWRHLDSSLAHFAGRGVYHGWVDVDSVHGCRFELSLGNVCDTFVVWVNDRKADFPDQVMKRVDVTELLQPGRNQIRVVVHSNLYNKVFGDSIIWSANRLKYLPRDYGIWESEHKKIQLLEYRLDDETRQE